MCWTFKCTCTPRHPSILFSIIDLKAQAVRLPVSKGAQILLSELLTWSGERGYCWWGKPAIAKDLHWSVSEVWRRATELKQAGLLEVIPRPGRSNYWVPLPGRNRMERLQKELAPIAGSRYPSYEKKRENLKRCTVPDLGTSTEQTPPSPELNENAVKNCSQEVSPVMKTTTDKPFEELNPNPVPVQKVFSRRHPIPHEPARPVIAPKPKTRSPITPDHLVLVDEIERVTGDTWSRGNFINLVRQVDEQTVWSALSVTKEKMSLESGVNAGAYFTATVKGLVGLKNLGEKTSGTHATHEPDPAYPTPRPTTRQRPHLFQPNEPNPEPVDPESLKKGWRISYKSGGISSMLSWIQRCVPASLDVTKLWTDIRSMLPETEESFAVDRFLDTVVTRMRHAERTAEVRV
jgi:hypothetical protein